MPSYPTHHNKITRRQFVRRVVLSGALLGLSACQNRPAEPLMPTRTQSLPTPLVIHTPLITSMPSPTLTPSPAPSPTILPALAVAARRIPVMAAGPLYDQGSIRQALEGMLVSLGGLTVKGARVGLKVNLTGGPWADGPGKPIAIETYVTHPAVAGALCELLIDAGASQINIMDGIWDETTFDQWGYTEMAKPLSARLVNLCKPEPYKDYQRFPVGAGRLVYDYFWLNPVLGELDVLISVAKLKVHSTAGVTLSMKNLIGLTPVDRYRVLPADTNRTALHAAAMYGFDERLPKVIIDLNMACPIQFALIDGIGTCEGGAGPWEKTLNPVQPGLLIAGANPVATDAVATHLMGFDPQGAARSVPFLHGENHLELAAQAGLGTNRLSDISILGQPVEELVFPFKPAQ